MTDPEPVPGLSHPWDLLQLDLLGGLPLPLSLLPLIHFRLCVLRRYILHLEIVAVLSVAVLLRVDRVHLEFRRVRKTLLRASDAFPQVISNQLNYLLVRSSAC